MVFIIVSILITLTIPVVVFSAEILIACAMKLPWRSGAYASPKTSYPGMPAPSSRPPVTILMPAHDEGMLIAHTLQGLQAHLLPHDRILVVADNCSDSTAAIARAHGAEVVERFNTELRGKGYALDHGVRHLASLPQAPEWVVIFDADCTLHPGSLDALAAEVMRTGRPAQAVYLMQNVAGNQAVSPVAEFAWRVRNLVRPAGLQALGGPCHLTGSGMAFPWSVLSKLPMASGEIAEDMKMGIDLARQGVPPTLALGALVTSTFPVSTTGAQTQRTRWEHGTLGMLFSQAPRMVGLGLLGKGKGLLYLALDMMVPPLALLVILVSLGFTLILAWSLLSGMHGALVFMSLLCLLLFISLSCAWWTFGRDLIAPSHVPRFAGYALGKLPIYVRFVMKRQMEWVRSKRGADDD